MIDHVLNIEFILMNKITIHLLDCFKSWDTNCRINVNIPSESNKGNSDLMKLE